MNVIYSALNSSCSEQANGQMYLISMYDTLMCPFVWPLKKYPNYKDVEEKFLQMARKRMIDKLVEGVSICDQYTALNDLMLHYDDVVRSNDNDSEKILAKLGMTQKEFTVDWYLNVAYLIELDKVDNNDKDEGFNYAYGITK